MSSGRNPFSFPMYENDHNFKGKLKTTKKPWTPTCDNNGAAQGQSPWKRLAETKTLSSKRREEHYFDPQTPLDKFDFEIKAVYDQFTDPFRDCNEVVRQRETVLPESVHGRQMKNRIKVVPPAFDPMYPPLRIEKQKRKPHPEKTEGLVKSHHSPTTNGGFSRGRTGGFYVI